MRVCVEVRGSPAERERERERERNTRTNAKTRRVTMYQNRSSLGNIVSLSDRSIGRLECGHLRGQGGGRGGRGAGTWVCVLL